MNINNIIIDFLKEHKLYLLAYILFMISYPINAVYMPKYYGTIVQDLKDGKEPSFKKMIGVLVCINIAHLFIDKLDATFIPKLQSHIRSKIIEVVLDNYKDKFEEQEVGSLISKISTIPIAIRYLVGLFKSHLIPISLTFATAIFRFFLIDRRVGSIVCTGIFLCMVILIPMIKKCINISSRLEQDTGDTNEDIAELFDNLMDIYSMNTYKKELYSLGVKQGIIGDKTSQMFESVNSLRVWLNTTTMSVFCFNIWYAYQLFEKGEIQISDMINITITSMYLMEKIGHISSQMPNIILNIGVYNRAKQFLKTLNFQQPSSSTFKIKEGCLHFENVSISYGDKKVITDFNLKMASSESVTISGKIGSGKSSLVKALLKLIPYKGTIYIDGVDISTVDPSCVRSQVLYIRQNPLPFNRTLYENIAYGNEESASVERVTYMFKKFGLDDFFDHDLNNKVGKKGCNLSGGQRQMIFLLRVLLSDNPIIILDEPNASLDEKSSDYIMTMLKEIISTRTVIIISHDHTIRELSDRTISL